MAIIPSGYAQLTLVYGGDALPQGAVTTWGVNIGGIGLDPQEALNSLITDAEAFHQQISVVTATLSRMELKIGPTSTGPTFETSVNTPGDQGTAGVPPNVSCLVRKTVPTVSGRFGGRAFLPAIPEGAVSSAGFIESATLGQFDDALALWYAALDTVFGQPVVFNNSSSTPREVSSYKPQARVATQRRRNRR